MCLIAACYILSHPRIYILSAIQTNPEENIAQEKDGKRVVISENVRDNKGIIVDGKKNWIVTSFDNTKSEKEKQQSTSTRVTPESDKGGRAVTSDAVLEGKYIQTQAGNQTELPKYDKTEKSNDTIYKSLLAERLSVTEPQDIEELAASLLYNSVKITPESFKNETGFGNAEQRNFVGMIARKENGGVSIERAGEILQEAYREDYPHLIDDTDANQGRNAIISLLSGVRTRKGINNLIMI